MSLTPEQEIKIEIVVLAEYLQCQPLSDAQIKLYAAELSRLGVSGLRAAIAALKADPEVWPGRFPLPGKIASYLTGSIDERVSESVARIMACATFSEVQQLSALEKEVVIQYGYKAIIERASSHTPTINAQVRDLLRSKLQTRSREESLGLHHLAEEARMQIARAAALPVPARDSHDAVPVPGRPFDESEG